MSSSAGRDSSRAAEGPARSPRADRELSDRQLAVLRAVVAGYVGGAGPVGSRTISHVLPVPLSAASIRNTMSELADEGLIEKPHRSAGRVPTARGLRLVVDRTDPRTPGRLELSRAVEAVEDADGDSVVRVASRLLSDGTRQIGLGVAPSSQTLVLQHVSLVRLSTERVLAVLVAQNGVTLQRVIGDDESGDQRELERIAVTLNERVAGLTLAAVRDELEREAHALRSQARSVVRRAVRLGLQALSASDADDDLVVAMQLALLDEPEFQDPDRIKQLFGALEARETLVRILTKMIDAEGPRVAFGDELGEPALRHLALVAAPYHAAPGGDGVLGVIGPSRMDYARVLGFVGTVSQLVTNRLKA